MPYRRSVARALCGFVVLVALFVPSVEVHAKECKKGKKLCGTKCIPAKKVCKEDTPAAGGEAAAAPAQGPQCKKGKKPCGDKCIPAKKVCKEEGGTTMVRGGGEPKLASASTAEVAAALESPAGQAMLNLAQALTKSGELDVSDAQRASFRQSLRGQRPPLPICAIGHVQLVRDCDTAIKGKVTLPCYLSVDEMAAVCEALGQKMPYVK